MNPFPRTPLPLLPSRVYPTQPGARSHWIETLRGPKNVVNASLPYAYLWEEETGPDGSPVATATVFLTNRECPYLCLMCDLWRNTLDEPVAPGAIAAQIRLALADLPPARNVKLYNSGSFFDPKAIPTGDYAEIAEAISGFERVIVECHPLLIGERTLTFRDRLKGRLEVAIGLETVHPEALNRLNKRFTPDDFRRAARFLTENGMDLRVFLLVGAPFLNREESRYWTERSLESAFDAGATVCCLIPVRGGNGAMEALAEAGEFHPPSLNAPEAAQEYGLRLNAGRVFSDTWDIERFFTCRCSRERAQRLEQMNREQRIPPPVVCSVCDEKEDRE
ncbi:MAG: hypothetical protein SFU56_08335 [Capsulimonadales bacterium]|nr:hypothetical protein [Capsulimonadales bacterium]